MKRGKPYEVMIPSREEILAAAAKKSVPLDEAALERALKIRAEQREGFERRLAAMLRDGQLLRNRKGALLVAEKLDLVSGRVVAHPDGFGFVTPDEEGEDLFLAPREMNQVLHGDRVIVRPLGRTDRRGRREAVIVEILARAQQRIVGTLRAEHGIWSVAAVDRRIQQDVIVEPDGRGAAKPGQVVTVELIAQPSKHSPPIGRIVEVLGEHADPGMEIEIALRKHQLPFEFPRAAETLAKRLPEGVRRDDLRDRVDLRGLPFVTIDGATARDFDDAVHVQPDGRGLKLYVAIADVSAYVKPDDALDREARTRGTSVYFPRRVIPMLPEKLSNGLCSLNPEVDRLALVCELAVSRAGKVGDYRFYPAVIRSQARLTYDQVAAALYATPPDAEAVPAALREHLALLDTAFRALAKARERRGAIDFETVETELEFDARGKILAIRPVRRNDAHRLIEECMLAANVCAADFLAAAGHKALYRIHEGPTAEKLEALREFLKSFGVDLGGADKPRPKDYARIIDAIRARPDAPLLQTVLLRSMQQAVYSPENVGHFGLAYSAYAHFTSPIRRYPDLLVHRAIKAVLAGATYDPGNWSDLGEHCSMTERRADDASRDVIQWLKCFYMQDHLGESFDGVITAVTGFGVFVSLAGLYIEGLVHISELGSDYFHHDAVRHELRGERTGVVYRLAGPVRVKVARVDMDTARIDFVLDRPEKNK